MADAGWYIVDRDPQGREAVAHWVRYPTQHACEAAISRIRIPAAGLLGAKLWDGSAWVR